jgi:hypothetical protein
MNPKIENYVKVEKLGVLRSMKPLTYESCVRTA